jgi:hypothetical protein
MIAQLQDPGMLCSCLCRPEHGTNFADKPDKAASESIHKRHCLWQLPLFMELVLGNSSNRELAPTKARWWWETADREALLEDPYQPTEVLAERDFVSNVELAKTLAFQCRIGLGGGANRYNEKLIIAIVNALGTRDSKVGTWVNNLFQPGDRPSWWGSNLGGSNFHSVSLWLSTANSRTPIHNDEHSQFLVQAHGKKHVTVFPGLSSVFPAASLERVKRIVAARGGPFNVTTTRMDMRNAGISTPWTTTDVSSTVLRCLLTPGDVLWMPQHLLHDVYSVEPSLSINMRFNLLESAGHRSNEKRTPTRRSQQQDL